MAVLLPALISGAAAVGSSWWNARSNRKQAEKTREVQKKALKKGAEETKIQRTQRHLIDELLGSVKGKGRFADLFADNVSKGNERFDPSNEAFQKSYVQPALSMFNKQIAPQIQQRYAQYGQQNNSGLDDQLLRAGVDLDQMLNQNFANFQQQAFTRQQNAEENQLNRKQNLINSILGQGPGRQNPNLANLPIPGATDNGIGRGIMDFGKSESFKNLYEQGLGWLTKDKPGFKPDFYQNDLSTFTPSQSSAVFSSNNL